MASQNWDENDWGTIENESAPLSSAAPQQPTNFSSQWLFEPDTAAPVWPQTYYEPPQGTSLGAPFAPPIDESKNPFDASFGDAMAWERWDNWEDIGYGGDDEVDVGLDAQHTRPGSAGGVSAQDIIISNPNPDIPQHGSSERASAYTVEEYMTSAEKKSPSTRPRTSGNWSRGNSQASTSWSGVSSKSTELLDTGHLPASTPRISFMADQDRRTTTHSDKFPMQTEFAFSPPASMSSARRRSEPSRSRGSRSTSVESRSARRALNHHDTEKKYRSRMSHQFASLLEALPEDLVAGAGSGGKGADGGKSMSKVDTMALAITHIMNLEAEEKELKDESLVLRGQVALYNRLFDVRGGEKTN